MKEGIEMLKEILKEELQKYGVDWSLEEFQKQIELAIMNNHSRHLPPPEKAPHSNRDPSQPKTDNSFLEKEGNI